MKDLHWIAGEYQEQNGSHIQVLDQPPSSLQFSRLLRIARPVKILGFHIPATARWSNEYLAKTMTNKLVSIAVTPNGKADAITEGPDGRLYFVEPHIEKIPFTEFMDKLSGDDGNVYYLQSQNGNLYLPADFQDECSSRSEYEPLRADVPSELSWCSEVDLDRFPDAVNIWIGNEKSVTSIHSDPYENIYTVVKGVKDFTLFPPTHACYMKEKYFPRATYTRSSPDGHLQITPSTNAPQVRWSSITDPNLDLPPDVRPIHVTVRAGEALYLPPGWWHYVRQAAETTIAVNWWYDMDMEGMTWVMLSFFRGSLDQEETETEELV